MTETMIIEALNSVQRVNLDPTQTMVSQSTAPDPIALEKFQAAMATPPTTAPTEIPFADPVARSWQMAHDNNQGIIHRMRALSELSAERALSAPELLELQYEVANLSFQQDVVAKVADKASQAVQTLIKNQ